MINGVGIAPANCFWKIVVCLANGSATRSSLSGRWRRSSRKLQAVASSSTKDAEMLIVVEMSLRHDCRLCGGAATTSAPRAIEARRILGKGFERIHPHRKTLPRSTSDFDWH